MQRVLVTGSTGFVGQTLCKVLAQSGYIVRAAARSARAVQGNASEQVVIGDIDSTTNWEEALQGVGTVIHTAARAHVLQDVPEAADLFLKTNAQGTLQLATAASAAGVRRFIYLSSIKVNGEETQARPFRATDDPQPRDAYGVSKWVGEKHLLSISAGSAMEAVIVRSPLVYGPGVRANFLRLMRWVDKGWPLPFGAIVNRRSLVSIWNLCDLLTNLVANPAAAGRTWMVSDGEDLSTPELIRRIGFAMGRRVRLPAIPASGIRLLGTIVGRSEEVARLCGSLVVEVEATRKELGWSPPVRVDDALARTTAWYLQTKSAHVA